MSTLWTPTTGFNNQWPTATRLKAGSLPLADYSNLDAVSGLNQVIGTVNKQGELLGQTNLSYIGVLTTKVDKALFVTLVDKINSINNANGFPARVLGAIPTTITRTFIGQLRDALEDYRKTIPVSNTAIQRLYLGAPPMNLNSFTEGFGSGVNLDNIYAGVFASRCAFTFTLPTAQQLNLVYTVTGSSNRAGSVTTSPILRPFSVFFLNGIQIFNFNSQDVATPIGSFQPTQLGDNIFNLGSFSAGDYTFCFSLNSDLAYIAATVDDGNGTGALEGAGPNNIYYES